MALSDFLAKASGNASPAEAPPDPAYLSGGVFAGLRTVGDSADLQRIVALPRRILRPEDYGPEIDAALRRRSSECRPVPPGTSLCPNCGCPLELWPLQRASFVEMKAAGGGLLAVPVGNGKTLIAALAGTVLGAKNTLLLLPAQMRAQFLGHDYPMIARHWRVPNLALGPTGRPSGRLLRYPDTTARLHVLSYEELGSPRRTDFLDKASPPFDAVVGDEAHKLRNASASRTKRVRRYLSQHADAVRVVWLSGTITKKSIRDYAHLARQALQHRSPLPHSWPVVEDWSSVLDASDRPAPPGQLKLLCEGDETPRDGFRRRLRQSLGVITASERETGASLVFDEARSPPVPDSIERALRDVRTAWVTPGGEVIADPLRVASACRSLACGFYDLLDWDKAPPHTREEREDWLELRRLWAAEVREQLKRARPGLDSYFLLKTAAAQGRWASEWYAKWAATASRFDLEALKVTVWVDDFLLKDAVAWGRKSPGIIWYDRVPFGEKLAEMAPDFRFYPPGKASDEALEKLGDPRTPRAEQTAIMSIPAHGTGKNLQYAWSRNLLAQSPSGQDVMQQLLGRTHRPGQPEDEVTFSVYWHTSEVREALREARKQARYSDGTLVEPGERGHKLLFASYAWQVEEEKAA